MSFVVLDTDVASAVLRGRVPGALATRLTGQSLAITFVTVGELTKWTLVRHWGPHDLRHFAATTMLSAKVPLAMASKTLRHSTVSVTTEIYAHLLRPVAQEAVDTIETALAIADAS